MIMVYQFNASGIKCFLIDSDWGLCLRLKKVRDGKKIARMCVSLLELEQLLLNVLQPFKMLYIILIAFPLIYQKVSQSQ